MTYEDAIASLNALAGMKGTPGTPNDYTVQLAAAVLALDARFAAALQKLEGAE
jgi:hypothetical protein